MDTFVPTITLESGEVIQADLVIGADGIHSKVRQSISFQPSKATPIGDAVYRRTVPSERMEADPALQTLLKKCQIHYWMGPERHIIGYPIVSGLRMNVDLVSTLIWQRGGKEYNMVLVHPDNDSVESWTTPGNVDEMRNEFAGWEER